MAGYFFYTCNPYLHCTPKLAAMKRSRFYFTFLILLLSFSCVGQPLKKALTAKDTAAAVILLQRGADVNEKDSAQGYNIIQSFVRWGDKNAVVFLLNHGCNPDKNPSPKGRTALHVACAYYSCKDICELLIANGANVNAVDENGATPLMLAAANGKTAVVQLLLQKGGKASQKDNKEKTALDYAYTLQPNVEEFAKKAVKDCVIDKAETIKILTGTQ
jgi:ankyrin repeat protein